MAILYDERDPDAFAGDLAITDGIPDAFDQISAARKSALFLDNSNSMKYTMAEEWEPLVDIIKERSGGYGWFNPGHYAFMDDEEPDPFRDGSEYQTFVNKLLTEVQGNPEKYNDVNVEDWNPAAVFQRAKERALAEKKRFEGLEAITPGGISWYNNLAGGAWAAAEDPANQAASLLGAAGSKTLLGFLFKEAAINMAIEAPIQYNVSKWYETLGIPYTAEQFFANVAAAGAFGVAVPLTIKIGGATYSLTQEQLAKGWDALKKDGYVKDGDALAVDKAIDEQDLDAKENPFDPSQVIQNVKDELAARAEADTFVGPTRLGEWRAEAEAEHKSRLQTAKDALEFNRPPEMSDEPNSIPVKTGDPAETDNLDNFIFKLGPDEIDVDAKTFQFKSGGDEFGVTEKLEDMVEWDPQMAGTVMVYEYADGRLFIADGHQRLALAKRIKAANPDADITLYATKMREVDGVTPQQATAEAALNNIMSAPVRAENDIIDAAKVLRVHPDKIRNLPRNTTADYARGLANLGDDAFGAVINGMVDPRFGSIVGKAFPGDEEAQLAALKVLMQTKPNTLREAELIVDQVKSVGFDKQLQESLFGDEMVAESLFAERAKILSLTMGRLKNDKKTFKELTRNADRIESEGNVLSADANKRRLEDDQSAIALLQAAANTAGPISSALTKAARDFKNTGKLGPAVDGFLDRVRDGISDGSFSRVQKSYNGQSVQAQASSVEVPSAAERAVDEFDDPAGPGIERQADQLTQDIFGEPPAKLDPPKPDEDLPGKVLEPDWRPYMLQEEGDVLVPLSSLKAKKVRPEGVKNAVPFMQQAAKGEIDKRPALLVKDNGDGTYTVRDGNSTMTIAQQAGWSEVPVKVVTDTEYAKQKAIKSIDRIFKQEKLGKTKRRYVDGTTFEKDFLDNVQLQLKERQARDVKGFMSQATSNHNALNKAAQDAASKLGIEFKAAPVKKLEKIKKKLAKKQRTTKHIYMISDAARTGVTARNMDEADAFIRELGKTFHIVDEGWIDTSVGYFDRKIMVVFDDGGLGEIQIWPPGMLQAKEAPSVHEKAGHEYYDIANDIDQPAKVRADAEQKMLDIYAEVIKDLDKSFTDRISQETLSKLGLGAPSRASQASTSAGGISTARSSERISEANSGEPPQPSPGVQQTATPPLSATVSPSLSRNNRIVSPGQSVDDGVDFVSPEAFRAAGSDDAPSEYIIDIGGQDVKISQDSNIPVGTEIDDVSGQMVTKTQTMREIEEEFAQDEKMLQRLEGCVK